MKSELQYNGYHQNLGRRNSASCGKGKELPLKQGNFYVLEVEDDIARYWNKQSPKRREDLYKQSVKEKKDIRLILDGFVHKPAHTK